MDNRLNEMDLGMEVWVYSGYGEKPFMLFGYGFGYGYRGPQTVSVTYSDPISK